MYGANEKTLATNFGLSVERDRKISDVLQNLWVASKSLGCLKVIVTFSHNFSS